MLSNDCLGWSDDEEDYYETERSRRTSVPRKRCSNMCTSSVSAGSKEQGSVSKKKRRSGKALTVEDIPAIVNAVVDSLPGPSTLRSSEEECQVAAIPRGKISRYSVLVCVFISKYNQLRVYVCRPLGLSVSYNQCPAGVQRRLLVGL